MAYAITDDTTLMAESEEELKSLLIEWLKQQKLIFSHSAGWKSSVEVLADFSSPRASSWFADVGLLSVSPLGLLCVPTFLASLSFYKDTSPAALSLLYDLI